MGLEPAISPLPIPERAASLVRVVMRAVDSHIREHGLRPGDPLPGEASFSASTGVSRAVVREAFRSLAALGIINVGNGRRPRVSAVDPSVLGLVIDHAVNTSQITIQQIYDVRRTVELRTASLAALRRNARDAEAISGHASAMRAHFADTEIVMEHDIAFHGAIARASRNPMFSLIVESFSVVTRQTWGVGWMSRPNDAERMKSVEGHEAIAAAISDGDPRRAEAAMAEHFDHSLKALAAAGIN